MQPAGSLVLPAGYQGDFSERSEIPQRPSITEAQTNCTNQCGALRAILAPAYLYGVRGHHSV